MMKRSGSEASKTVRMIRILAAPRPARTAEDRLAKIGEIATGKASADDLFRNRNALRLGKEEPPQRKAKPSRDRKETGGRDREE